MLAALGIDLDANTVDLSFREPPLSDRSGRPLMFGMGDAVAGPLLGLFYDAPSTPEQLAGPPDLAPAHSHSCDNFRICMKGELIVGQERYRHGEFRLQQSGRPYGQDGDAPHVDGNWRIIFFADRRGHLVRPTNPDIRAQYRAAAPASQERYGDLLPELLDDDDGGVVGMVTNLTTPLSKLGHIDGSFRDAETWDTLGASKVAAALLGLPDLGPVVLLLRTPAAQIAAPACTFGTEGFRLIVAGSYTLDGRARTTGDMRFQAADTPWERVVAGPDGLDEVVILGDRRGAFATLHDESGAGAWTRDFDSLLSSLRGRLGELA
ncbi:MAG: hypothetical protein WD271_09745 [Acidimicrobiia bacterium]